MDLREAQMSETLDMLKSRLVTLPSGERAELAQFLIESLEPDGDDGIEADWDEELARRAGEIRAGTVQGKSADQVFAELRARFP
jgi:putative addiction module component (TIGR02574 family)